MEQPGSPGHTEMYTCEACVHVMDSNLVCDQSSQDFSGCMTVHGLDASTIGLGVDSQLVTRLLFTQVGPNHATRQCCGWGAGAVSKALS